jgi:hypothetical protein
MERLEFDLLFRWFVGVGVDDAVWDHSTFSKNRDRLLEGDLAAKLLSAVLSQPRVKRLLSTDHFSVDGTLVEARASMKSFRPKDGSGEPPAGDGRTRGEFPWPEALERDARLEDRSGSAALSQGTGQGGQALFHGARADGEPQRPRRRRLSDRSQRPRRADRGAAHDRAARGAAEADHARRRQGLRRRGFRQRAAFDERDAPRSAEHERPLVGDRRPHDPSRGLRGQPTHSQADRGGLRLDQDGRRPGANQVSRPRTRGLGLHLGGRRLQSGAAAEAPGGPA